MLQQLMLVINGKSTLYLNMYYHLERNVNCHWLSAGYLLHGPFQSHLQLLQDLGLDFRAKRITPREAMILLKNGFKILTKMESYGE
jgi:hypothetical protein